jgi:hypothetical protein
VATAVRGAKITETPTVVRKGHGALLSGRRREKPHQAARQSLMRLNRFSREVGGGIIKNRREARGEPRLARTLGDEVKFLRNDGEKFRESLISREWVPSAWEEAP